MKLANGKSFHLPKFLRQVCAALSVLALLTAYATTAFGETPAGKRAEIRKARTQTLQDLYKTHPPARAHIQKAVGYGVFSNVGVNLILLSAAAGGGVVHDNKSGKDVYMKMISGGVGFGLGVKDFRGVFVFTSSKALSTFLNSGWEASAQADAAAVASGKGGSLAGAITVAPGMELYQLTKNGLALQATIQGTKYYKDSELN